MKPMLKRLGKGALSISALVVSILILTPIIAFLFKLIFKAAVKE